MRFLAFVLGLVVAQGTLLNNGARAATSDLRRDIEAKLVETQRKAAPDLTVGAASCPAALSKAVAKSTPGVHRCFVVVEGVKVPYDITLRTSAAVKGGSYTLRNAKAVIDTKKLATIAATVVDDPSKVKITCGAGRVVVADPGAIISCTVVEGAATDTLKFEVKDLSGLVSFVP
jgi:hypothetical protein